MGPPEIIHNLEVFTVDAAGAYEVAPTILQNGRHYNILKVKWIWNKAILGLQIWLKIETDDDKFFTSKTVDPATAYVSDCFGDRPEQARKCWNAVESVKNVEYMRRPISTTTTNNLNKQTEEERVEVEVEVEVMEQKKKRKRGKDEEEEEDEDVEQQSATYVKKKKIQIDAAAAAAAAAAGRDERVKMFESIAKMRESKSGVIDINDKYSLPRALEQFANIMQSSKVAKY